MPDEEKWFIFFLKKKATKRSESKSESVFGLSGQVILYIFFLKTPKSIFCLSQHTYKTHSTAAGSRGGECLEIEGRAKSLRQPEARQSPN